MSKKKLFQAAVLVSIGLVIGITLSLKSNLFQVSQAQIENKPLGGGYDLQQQTENVASIVGKAVVSISTEITQRVSGFSESPFGFGPEDRFFRQFFEDFFGNFPRQYKERGLGSGVIIDKGGYILTNEHVIDRADKIKVKLSDGREFRAKVVGKDVRSDLAVIKINAHNLPVAELGDSDALKTGQWVEAIGNPFGFAIESPQPTVTVGVISALDRDLPGLGAREGRNYSGMIQTDAAINPGNSGGPLVDMEGKVIGINTAIITTSGGYQGIGFAIPINKAKSILRRLIKGEKIAYGWLGVSIQNLNQNLQEYFGLKEREGVIVVKVFESSPAAKAGIKEGDVILEFNHKKIKRVSQLVNIVGDMPPGSKAEVVVLRKGQRRGLVITLGKRPENVQDLGVKGASFRGMQVEDIRPDLAERFRLKETEGVVIVYVKPDSPADKAGLEIGDVILSVEGKQITNKADFIAAVKNLKGSCLIKTSRGFFVIKEE